MFFPSCNALMEQGTNVPRTALTHYYGVSNANRGLSRNTEQKTKKKKKNPTKRKEFAQIPQPLPAAWAGKLPL